MSYPSNVFLLTEDTDIGLTRKDSEARSLRSGKTFSEHSLIDALSIQDGESIHHLTDETKSLKSLGSSHGVVRGTGRIDETLRDGAVDSETSFQDGHLSNDMEHGDGDSYFGDDDGSGEYGVTSDGNGGDGDSYSEHKENIKISNDIPYSYTDGQPDDQGTTQIMPTIDVAPATELQAPHISLSSLQDEVRLVATAVLSRPKSGRTLEEDAEMATFLLLERMQGLLDPHVLTGGSPCSQGSHIIDLYICPLIFQANRVIACLLYTTRNCCRLVALQSSN